MSTFYFHFFSRSLIVLVAVIPVYAVADITVTCAWTVKSEWKQHTDSSKIHVPFIVKSLFTNTPKNCAVFNLSSPLPEEIDESIVPQLFDTYQAPYTINLSCPKGYSPAADITWGQIGGVERQFTGQRVYYLDFYRAELPCIKK